MSAHLPYAWLCRSCDLHSDGELATRALAEIAAHAHDREAHPGRKSRIRIIEGYARCQWRAHRFSRICGAPASWAHPPGSRVHLCERHRSA